MCSTYQNLSLFVICLHVDTLAWFCAACLNIATYYPPSRLYGFTKRKPLILLSLLLCVCITPDSLSLIDETLLNLNCIKPLIGFEIFQLTKYNLRQIYFIRIYARGINIGFVLVLFWFMHPLKPFQCWLLSSIFVSFLSRRTLCGYLVKFRFLSLI